MVAGAAWRAAAGGGVAAAGTGVGFAADAGTGVGGVLTVGVGADGGAIAVGGVGSGGGAAISLAVPRALAGWLAGVSVSTGRDSTTAGAMDFTSTPGASFAAAAGAC